MSLHGGHAYPHDPQHGVGKGMSEPGLKDGGGPMGYDVVDRKIAEVRRRRSVGEVVLGGDRLLELGGGVVPYLGRCQDARLGRE